MRSLLAVVVLAAACGPKPAPAPIPRLPSDGDANVAKPPPPPVKPEGDDPWTGKTDLVSAPAAKAPARVELPPISDFKLGNGLQVYVVKNDRLPVVSFQVAIRAGRLAEPRARLGVAEATADMMVKGTSQHTAVALAKTIDFVGGTIAADATFEATLISCSALARNKATCLQLLPEMLTQSTFPADELSKVKEQMIGTVRQRLDDAGSLASEHVQNLLWGNEHVRGWINSESSVNSIRRDDLLAWHKTWYVPNNAMLVVSGDVDPKQLKSELERAFGGWKAAPLPPVPTYHEPGLSGIRIRLVDKPGQTQTHVRVAQFGIRHDDPRFFDTLVWNYVLGGGSFSSRLMKTVRVQGGKTNGASSSFDRNLDKGSFVAQTFTRNSEAIATTKLLLAELAKMAKEGPSQDEVNGAISNLAGGYEVRFQSASDVGSALVGAELHGFGLEYLSNFPLAVGKVDVESAKRAATEILDPRNYVLVLVGDAKDLEPQLKKEGWRYEKVMFNDPISPEPKQEAAPLDAKAAAGMKQLLVEALIAKGGKAKLGAVKSMHLVAGGTTVISGQSLPFQIERTFELPDRMWIDAMIAKQVRVTIAVDGKSGWEMGPNPKTGAPELIDLSGNDMAAAQFEAWREAELILLKANDPAAKLTPFPDENIDGKPHAVIRLNSPFGNLGVSIYIDRKTKLVTRMTYTDQGQTETDDFSDYKDIGGIKVAHKRTQSSPGRLTTLDISKIEFDQKVDSALFKKPEKP